MAKIQVPTVLDLGWFQIAATKRSENNLIRRNKTKGMPCGRLMHRKYGKYKLSRIDKTLRIVM